MRDTGIMNEGGRTEDPEIDALGEDFKSGARIPFRVASAYGRAEPHSYVILDIGADGDLFWWFHPDQAEALGIRL